MIPLMIIQRILLLLEANPVIVGGSAPAVTAAANEVAQVAGAADPAAGGMFGSMSVLLIYAAIIGALYFFMFRPQRKRDKETKQMQENIRTGDNVVTTAGFYGKIVDVGEDCFIVEFGANRGVRIPVRKSDISGIKEPKTTPPPAKIESKD